MANIGPAHLQLLLNCTRKYFEADEFIYIDYATNGLLAGKGNKPQVMVSVVYAT